MKQFLLKTNLIFIFFSMIGIWVCQDVYAVRIKDLASLRGGRDNQLIGFSIVVGLNGTGDAEQSLLARKPLRNALERMGISISLAEIKGRSIAAVMVTATLPPFAKQGQKLDVNVSTLGDAISIRGGTLVMSPLRAPNRQVFAVAQGPVVGIPLGLERPAGREITGGKEYQFDLKKNLVPTNGKVINGAIVEKEITLELNSRTRIFMNIHNPDFTTAYRLAKVVSLELGDGSAKAVDAGTVEISVPSSYLGQTVELISTVENMEIEPDAVAKVVIDERTGTIVMGTNVKILPIAIAHDNLSVKIGKTADTGKKGSNPQQESETKTRVILFKGGVDIKEVVDGLNKIGISSSDLVEVLKTIKAAGALHADLVIQ